MVQEYSPFGVDVQIRTYVPDSTIWALVKEDRQYLSY
jgi:hypothetical protein